MSEPLKHNESVGFIYTVTMEQMEKHATLPPEAVLQWIEEMAISCMSYKLLKSGK